MGLRYLARLGVFADSLVERGRVLPSVRLSGPGLAVALWQPVVTGADAAWLQAVAALLPAACHAEGDSGSRRAQVIAALDALVDAAVRSRIGAAAKGSGGKTGAATRTVHGRWRLARAVDRPAAAAVHPRGRSVVE